MDRSAGLATLSVWVYGDRVGERALVRFLSEHQCRIKWLTEEVTNIIDERRTVEIVYVDWAFMEDLCSR